MIAGATYATAVYRVPRTFMSSNLLSRILPDESSMMTMSILPSHPVKQKEI